MKLANTLKRDGVRVLWVSRDPVGITRDYCLKHGIPMSDVLADPPYRTYLQLGQDGFRILCWLVRAAWWRRCGLDVWIQQDGTPYMHISANEKMRFLGHNVRWT